MALKDWVQGNSFKWFIFPLVFTDLIVFDEVIDRIVAANGPFDAILGWSYLLFFFKLFFFLGITTCLTLLFTRWRPMRHQPLKHFLVGLCLTCCAALFVWLAVRPTINRINTELYEQMFRSYSEDPFIMPSYKQIRYYFFHEPASAWINKLFLLFVTFYTLSLLYAFILRNEEMKRNYIKLQNESLSSQLNALHNQIHPHFFFNALNSLGGLIAGEEKERALAYLNNLSALFRYILNSQQQEWVTLREELALLDKYQFMLTIKYGERLTFERQIAPETLKLCLPTLSLLPLVENICRHNEISNRHPVRITLVAEGYQLRITNPKHPLLDEVEKHGIGLSNLNQRFLLQSGQPIQINDREETFEVILPLMSHPKTALTCKS